MAACSQLSYYLGINKYGYQMRTCDLKYFRIIPVDNV